ncbi:MAG: helix-turn-helix domain-containing protein [Candidatus Gastranaerophilales bacterium]|nr:helix-turn-helix domain-containing protein [Candidatus Gastranaerophilales bacterium]
MTKKTNRYIFGQRVKYIRKKRNLTQAKLAEKLDMSTNFIGMIERGERSTTIDKMFQIIEALEITPAKFFENIT